MNFSNSIKYSGEVQYSPNGNYLAIAKGKNLIVYETKSLAIKQKYSFNNPILQLEWSPDSNLILIQLLKVGQCYIKAIDFSEWNCLIDEGTSGISYVKWSSDSRKVLVFDEYNTKITVYSLIDNSLNVIASPKYNNDKGLSFSLNGYFMALIERKDWHDSIGIYYVGNWSLVTHFSIETNDAQGIQWNKDNTALIIWDTPIENRFYIYSPTGNLIISHETGKDTLGVVNVKTSPNGHVLSIGCFDQSVLLYNQMTWKFICRLNHSLSEVNKKGNVNVFKEEEMIEGGVNVSKYVECALPVSLSNKSKLGENKSGVKLIEYSFDSNYLATVNDMSPNIVWLWQISSLSLHTVIIQSKPIKQIKWSPNNHNMIIGTENPKLYFFSLTDMYIVDLLNEKIQSFSIKNIKWNSDGQSYLLCDKYSLIIGYNCLSNEEFEGNE